MTGSAWAAEIPLKAPPAEMPVKALPFVNTDPLAASQWSVEAGGRYWYSWGQLQKTLYNVSGNTANSRLSYNGLNANSGEAFFRVDHLSGAFLKGYVGAGTIFGGSLTDEDFPPNSPGGVYSSTNSQQRNGTLQYFDIDAGVSLLKDTRYRVGAFAGYQQWHEAVNAYGCVSNVAGSVCDPPAQQPYSVLTISQDAVWRSVRVGTVGDVNLTERIKFTGEVAYVPRTYLTAADTHWLRLGLFGGFSQPTPESGRGQGVELEGMLSYRVADWLVLGAGGRYWSLWTGSTTGNALFNVSAIPRTSPQPIGFSDQRYGVFAQASICLQCLKAAPWGTESQYAGLFNYAAAPSATTSYSWTGFYGGASAGGGFNQTVTSLSSLTPSSALFGASLGTVPQSHSVPSDGFVGGGQGGYNYQLGAAVLGAEADISYSGMRGSDNIVTFGGAAGTQFTQNINWIGTVRGRVGVAPPVPTNGFLVYGTGGLAYGGTNASVALAHPAGACQGLGGLCGIDSRTQTSVGWAAGGGFEVLAARNVTFKAEYLFVDLGQVSDLFPYGGFGTISTATHFQAQIVRAGVNYKLSSQ
jgi:opacity protein-like surface antigen